MPEFQPYLDSIALHYAQWWDLYTLTDSESREQINSSLWLLAQIQAIDDATLEYTYFNYLQWTLPLILMLTVVNDDVLTVRLVEKAFAVDFMLGAQLAGAANQSLHPKFIGFIGKLDVPTWLKIKLLREFHSDFAIPVLIKIMDDYYGRESIIGDALNSLAQIGSKKAISELLKMIECGDSDESWGAAEALGKVSSEEAVAGLVKLIEHGDRYAHEPAIYALGRIKSEKSTYDISESENVESKVSVNGLLRVLQHSDQSVRTKATEALISFKEDHAAHILPSLIRLLPTKSGKEALVAIQGIQANCKFYNYEIHRKAQTRVSTVNQQVLPGSPIAYAPNATEVKILD